MSNKNNPKDCNTAVHFDPFNTYGFINTLNSSRVKLTFSRLRGSAAFRLQMGSGETAELLMRL